MAVPPCAPGYHASKIDGTYLSAQLTLSGAKYEIQLSNGGGQFLPIQSGTVKANQAETVTFTPSGASDIRIVIKEGKAQVAEIKLSAR